MSNDKQDGVWKTTSGTVPGRRHARTRSNNQDAHTSRVTPDLSYGVVADGCGSSRHSEVGSIFGVDVVSSVLEDIHDNDRPSADRVRREVDRRLVSSLERVVNTWFSSANHDDLSDFVSEKFLFTYHVLVARDDLVFGFGAGDGVWWTNETFEVLDNPYSNAPAYPAYRYLAMKGEGLGIPPSLLCASRVHFEFEPDEVEAVGIGTDGLMELQERSEESLRDGSEVGTADQFLQERYFANPTLVDKRLAAIGDVNGKLTDDTTIAMVRRGIE